MRAAAIVNPAAGSAAVPKIVSALCDTAKQLGIQLRIETTVREGSTADLARSLAHHADILVAVGGDGTVSDVITGSLGHEVAIGVIPAGSTNMIAKDLRIPRNPRLAARVALGEGQPVLIDVASAGNTTCVHIAGAGYDAEIMSRTSHDWKRRVGWLAYVPAAVSAARFPAFRATITVDGATRTRSARLVFCAVGGSILHSSFKVGDGIDRTDGLLDVCVWNPPNVAATCTCLFWIGVGRPGSSRWLVQTRGKVVNISADREVAFEVDGDVVGSLPIEIEMLNQKITVLTPW